MLPRTMVLRPAYARTYTRKEQALEAWNAGLDFQSYNGPYTSKNESDTLKAMGYSSVEIRYGKRNEKAIVVQL